MGIVRFISLLAILFFRIETYAKHSKIPESIRNEFASEMFEAFITQSYGKSTHAFCQFDAAREKAKKAGEHIFNLIAIEKLFAWYRMYGSSMRLFYKNPTGNDRILGEYRSFLVKPASTRQYESEWGNNPEQARLIREFIFGVGEVISGVFCATVTGGTMGTVALGVVVPDGVSRIYTSLNSLWTQHQAALLAFQDWEQNTLKQALEKK
jgi:hypothetical protein